MVSPENTGPDDPFPSAEPRGPHGPNSPDYPDLRTLFIGATEETALELADMLLEEAYSVRSMVMSFGIAVGELAQHVLEVSTRRGAAQIGTSLMDARLSMDAWLGEADVVLECADFLWDLVGFEDGRVIEETDLVQIRVLEVLEVARNCAVQAEEPARIGELATTRISGLAEAEMLYPQILRDLDRLDLGAADTQIARLAELDQELATQGTAATLGEVRRLRASIGDAHGHERGGDSGGSGGDGDLGAVLNRDVQNDDDNGDIVS